MYTAIMKVGSDGRVAKFLDFETQAEADAHVAKFADTYPDAFAVSTPNAPLSQWKVANKTVSVEAPPERIPNRVSSRQFKMQLYYAGLLDAVDAWVAAQSKPVQLAYENSGTFVRDDAMMEQGFAALGYTTKQIDDFFLAASKL